MGLDKEFRIEELIQSGSKAIVSLNEEGQQTYNVASPEGDRDGETFGYLETPKYNQSEANKVVDTVVDELIGEEAEIQSERYVLKSVYDGLSREFDNLSDQIENLQTQINALNSQIASLESEKASLTSQVQSKDGIIASLQEQVTRLNGEIQSLNAEKQQLQNQIEDLKTQISQQSDQITSLNAQIDSLNKQIEALRGEIQVKNETITSNENELNDLRLQIRDLRNQLQQANSQNISLAGSLTDAKDQNTQLSQENSSLQSQLSQATSTIAQLRQTIDELRARLNEEQTFTTPGFTSEPETGGGTPISDGNGSPPNTTTQPPFASGLTAFSVSRGITQEQACSGAGSGTLWGNSSVFENVTQWFRNSQGDSFNSGAGFYGYEGQVMFINENGSRGFVDDCPVTVTTTQATTTSGLTAFSASRGSTQQEACSGANPVTLWGNSSVFANVTQWYANSQGSIIASFGFYAYDGQVVSVNSNGSVSFLSNCSTPTTQSPTTTTTTQSPPIRSGRGAGGSGGFTPEIDSENPSGDPRLNNENIFNVF